MRLARLTFFGDERSGVVAEDGVHLLPPGVTVDDLVRAGLERTLEAGAAALRDEPVPLDDVVLLAPLRPRSMRDFVAFEEHVRGVRRSIDGVGGVPDAWYDAPTFYFTNSSSVIATGDDVPVPGGSRRSTSSSRSRRSSVRAAATSRRSRRRTSSSASRSSTTGRRATCRAARCR